MLFYIEYGCSTGHEQLIVNADNFDRADEYASQAAEEVYYSYDCNYLSDEEYEQYNEAEISDIEYQNMLSDVYWVVEPFDEKNEDHVEALNEQNGIPFEV